MTSDAMTHTDQNAKKKCLHMTPSLANCPLIFAGIPIAFIDMTKIWICSSREARIWTYQAILLLKEKTQI